MTYVNEHFQAAMTAGDIQMKEEEGSWQKEPQGERGFLLREFQDWREVFQGSSARDQTFMKNIQKHLQEERRRARIGVTQMKESCVVNLRRTKLAALHLC